MAEKSKYEKLRWLIREAIGSRRTQLGFAVETGISPEHLSRMLNNPEISKPHDKTLQKIAEYADNGVTYKMLKNACKKESEVRFEKDWSETDKIIYLIGLIEDDFKDLIETKPFSRDVDYFMDANYSLSVMEWQDNVKNRNTWINEPRELSFAEREKHRLTEVVSVVKYSMDIDDLHVEFDINVYHWETKGNNVIIGDVEVMKPTINGVKYGEEEATVKALRHDEILRAQGDALRLVKMVHHFASKHGGSIKDACEELGVTFKEFNDATDLIKN